MSQTERGMNTLFDYLRSLDAMMLNEVYAHPCTCLAVFREMPELAKQFIYRLLFIREPIPQTIVMAWVDKNHLEQEHQEACDMLRELRVWQSVNMGSSRRGWRLDRRFQENLKMSLFGGGQPWLTNEDAAPERFAKDEAFLDQYSNERWEYILQFMVNPSDRRNVSAHVIDVLKHSRLLVDNPSTGQLDISKNGFQFLLTDRHTQVWQFVLHYLNYLKEKSFGIVSALQFIFQLSFSTFGKCYSTDGLPEEHLFMMQHLREYGLVYQRSRKEARFYPTRLAVSLASGLKGASTAATAITGKGVQAKATTSTKPGVSSKGTEPAGNLGGSAGYIVVETNYRVYCYTDSTLKTALVHLFAEVLYRFPNLVVAILTRDSIRRALLKGITAEQIITFLTTNAHDTMRQHVPVLPITIVDQIRLWELERERFEFQPACLYEQFITQAEFVTLRDFAKNEGVLLWENAEQRKMVVTRAGHEAVKKFRKENQK